MHQNHSTELVVALDFARPERALEIVDHLSDLSVIYKVGIELYLAGGPEIVRELVHRRCRVFLDLKFHDIPSVVAKAARQAALLQVEMFSVHLAGGSAMVKAINAELSDIPQIRPRIMGVSVLTSFDDVRWAEVTKALTGHAVDTHDSVLDIVDHATRWGIDGIICSALELEEMKSRFPGLYAMVGGVRPEGYPTQDQARIMTPQQAHEVGANAVILGRPLLDAENPRSVAEAVLKELSVSRISA